MTKRNLLLEYSEELAIRIAKLCTEHKIDSNTVFQIKKSSSSVFANITEAQYPQSLADMHSKFEIARKEHSPPLVGAFLFGDFPRAFLICTAERGVSLHRGMASARQREPLA